MPKTFFYSIDLLIKSELHLQQTILSVTSEEAFFQENIQLNLIDTVCSDQTLAVCDEFRKKFPDNVYYFDAAGKTEAEAYNDTKTLCFGTYIGYINNYGEYSKKALRSLQEKILRSEKIPALCLQPFVSGADDNTNTSFTSIPDGIVKLKETPDCFVPMLGCYLFHKKIVSHLFFDEKIMFHADIKLMTEALLQTDSYIFTSAFQYTVSQFTDHDWFRYVPQYSRRFYSQTIEEMIVPTLIGCPGSVFAQSVMMYLIETRFALNQDERYKYVIIGKFVDEFFRKVSEALKFIDNAVILNRRLCKMAGLDEEMTFRLLRLKYRLPEMKPEIDLVLPKETVENSYFTGSGRMIKMTMSGEFAAHYQKALIGTSREITAEIKAVNYDEDGLYVDACLYGCAYFEQDQFQVFVNINNEKRPVIPSQVYTLRKYFDVPFLRHYSFRFFIPVSHGKMIDSVFLTMKHQRLSFRIGMTFHSVFSRLSSALPNSYWTFLDRVMIYDRKSRSIMIRRATKSLLRICETKFISDASSIMPLSEAVYYRQLRKNIRTMLSEKIDSKYIMFYDEMGSRYNGDILFRYFSRFKNNDKVEVFFSAKVGTEEFEQLTDAEYPNILECGSKKATMLAVCSDLIFASDCDVYESLMFNKNDLLMLRDLLSAKIISDKNFFITYGTAQFDNRLRDNIQFFFCASEKEKQHILREVYDYDEAMIRLTGYPILDTLSDEREKLILIAPGDRRQFCIYKNSDYYRFSESRFFRLYNDLLTDNRLHSALKEKGYRIALMLPFTIEKYLPLFASSDVITLCPTNVSSETELVKKASLLITDYSDLQFRFAYLNKPICYYFPQGLPIPQELKNEGLADNCFGKLFFDHEKLVDHLIHEIGADFPQPEPYQKMCREFFAYHDKHNCRRILNTVKEVFLSDTYKNQ